MVSKSKIFFLFLQTKPSFCRLFAWSQLDFSAIPVSISAVSLEGYILVDFEVAKWAVSSLAHSSNPFQVKFLYRGSNNNNILLRVDSFRSLSSSPLYTLYSVQCTITCSQYFSHPHFYCMRSSALNKRLQLYTCFLTLRKSKHTTSKLISIFIIQILLNIQTHILSNIPFCSLPNFELLLFLSDSLYLLFESLHDG
jgi:hypothetical protein